MALFFAPAAALAWGILSPPPPPPPSSITDEWMELMRTHVVPPLAHLAACVATPTFLLCVLLLSPCMYLFLNNVVPLLLGGQDLKKKYGAKWALVTGSSSGIGKELARTLLKQGLDVILIAREEPLFDEALAELKAQFPERSVLQVNANLSDASGGWMDGVKSTVGDKDVQCVFLNAGYILTGMYEQHPLKAHLANLHCNLTANVWLSHFFYERLVAKSLRGCIVFTSSSASYLPNPFAALYAATKSGVSALAASLAVEARPRGIHVHSMHPSPVNSRFSAGGGNDIKNQAKIEAMAAFYAFATGPEALPRLFLKHIGRGAIVADLGGVSVSLRLVVHLIGYNFMALMTALTAPLTPDYKKYAGRSKKAA
jgi:short-subunit dehydrogenase